MLMTDQEKKDKIKFYIIWLDLNIKATKGQLNSQGYMAVHNITERYGFDDNSGPQILKLIDELGPA